MSNFRNIDVVALLHPLPEKLSLFFGQKFEQFVGTLLGGHSVSIHSNPFRQFVGTADDRQDSANVTPPELLRCPTILELPQERHLLSDRRETPSRLRSALRNGWGRIKAFSHAFDDSWISDLFGVIALAIMIYIGFIFSGLLS